MPSLSQRADGELDYANVRDTTVRLAQPLTPEDATAQSMPDASPAKWHLAHTTWFFEEFVLSRCDGYRRHDAGFAFLFNSYYQSVGAMHARPARGLLTRPGLAAVLAYRRAVDDAVLALLARGADAQTLRLVQLGLQHEQQHQELILTDIKHLFSLHPAGSVYRDDLARWDVAAPPLEFVVGADGIRDVGRDADDGFTFDCETPRHQTLLHPHQLGSRPVTNAEYLEFIRAGGYDDPRWWLSEGHAFARQAGWRGPLYWDAAREREFTLGGWREIQWNAPVCHVSHYEADAYARFRGARLPTEFEWETAAAAEPLTHGNDAATDALQPMPARDTGVRVQMLGDVWEWTASPYLPYPGFTPLPGALGEYNGKFMSGQMVLRGGSCATPAGHVRSSYRNFFRPGDRWQFSGIRLARNS